jgi:uncharacterized membrane protein YkoI
MTIDPRRLLLPACGALLLLGAGPALADDRCNGAISRAQAEEIARGVGIAQITEVDCDDDEWELEGRDASGRKIEVEISAQTGEVRKVERDG